MDSGGQQRPSAETPSVANGSPADERVGVVCPPKDPPNSSANSFTSSASSGIPSDGGGAVTKRQHLMDTASPLGPGLKKCIADTKLTSKSCRPSDGDAYVAQGEDVIIIETSSRLACTPQKSQETSDESCRNASSVVLISAAAHEAHSRRHQSENQNIGTNGQALRHVLPPAPNYLRAENVMACSHLPAGPGSTIYAPSSAFPRPVAPSFHPHYVSQPPTHGCNHRKTHCHTPVHYSAGHTQYIGTPHPAAMHHNFTGRRTPPLRSAASNKVVVKSLYQTPPYCPQQPVTGTGTPAAALNQIRLNSSGEEDLSPSALDFAAKLSQAGAQQQPVQPQQVSSPCPTAADNMATANVPLRQVLGPLDNHNSMLYVPPFAEMASRQHHNAKERMRRSRIKESCQLMRELVPGMTDKTDKATVFEYATQYILYIKQIIGTKYDREFLQKYSPY